MVPESTKSGEAVKMNNSTNNSRKNAENKIGAEKAAVIEVLWATPQAGLSSLLNNGQASSLLSEQVSAKLLNDEVVIKLLCRPANCWAAMR